MCVPELRAATDVRGPISGVHVADGDKIARAGKGQNLAEPRKAGRKRDGAIRLRQRWEDEPRGRLPGREKTSGSFGGNRLLTLPLWRVPPGPFIRYTSLRYNIPHPQKKLRCLY